MPKDRDDDNFDEMNDWMDYLSNVNNDTTDSNEMDEFIDEEDNFDTELEDLLNMLNPSQQDENENRVSEVKSYDTDDDIMSMFTQEEEGMSSDFDEINKMLNSSGSKERYSENKEDTMDVGDIFSDALKVVTSLKDDMEEDDILTLIPEESKLQDIQNKSNKKQKRKIFKETSLDKPENIEENEKKRQTPFSKGLKGLFTKKDKVDSEGGKNQFSSEESLLFHDLSEKTPVEPKKKEKIKKAKKKKVKATKKPATTKKANTKAGAINEDEIDTSRSQMQGKKSKTAAAKKKKVKPEKTQKEVLDVLDDLEDNESKINFLAASLVVFFLGIMTIVVVAGINLFSYSLSIKNATNYFERQKYTQAYNEVYGVDVKDEDIEIYDKIITVMYVNKQLNSYNNFYAIEEYPKALEALLKGLQRYEKYIELATVYGIKSDLDYVRGQILAELEQEFKITEKDAMKLINNIKQEDYTTLVYDMAREVVDKK